jgi:hypothetical protein
MTSADDRRDAGMYLAAGIPVSPERVARGRMRFLTPDDGPNNAAYWRKRAEDLARQLEQTQVYLNDVAERLERAEAALEASQ